MNCDCLYVIGDSFAAGHEVSTEDNFASIIGRNYNIPVINKGVPGASNFYTFRQIYLDIPKLLHEKKKPLVIVIYTQWSREEFFVQDYVKKNNDGLVTLSTNPWLDNEFFKIYYKDHYDENYTFNKTLLYINAIQNLLKVNNIPRLECFSMTHYNHVSHIKQYELDETCMMPIDLIEKGGLNKFYTPHDLQTNSGPNGHLTELGNKIVADWFIEKITNLYGNIANGNITSSSCRV